MSKNHNRLKKNLHKLAAFAFCMLIPVLSLQAREVAEINPRTALLKSFAMPGWGHYYVDREHWRRGQYHLAAEIVLIASYLGFRRHSSVLEQNMFTFASAYSGIDIKKRDRSFQLAVGNYHSLEAYNDYQQRSRNLDRLYPNTAEYRWEWESRDKRLEYRDIRGRWDQTNLQLPALLSLMVVNRVISGLSAFTRARSHNAHLPEVNLSYNPDLPSGIQANVSFQW